MRAIVNECFYNYIITATKNRITNIIGNTNVYQTTHKFFVICKFTRKILHCIDIKIAKYIQGGKVFQLICKALVAKFSVVCRTSETEQTIYKDGNMCFANLVNN